MYCGIVNNKTINLSPLTSMHSVVSSYHEQETKAKEGKKHGRPGHAPYL